MTEKEKVEALHSRMALRRHRRARRKTASLSALCLALSVCLLGLIFGESAAHRGGTAGLYSGAIMLYEEAGVYVLVALAAFMVGVVITVLCLRYRKKGSRDREDKSRDPEDDS